MDDVLFNKLIEQLEKLSKDLESLKVFKEKNQFFKENQEILEDTITNSLLKDRTDSKFGGNEKRKIQSIAKVFKNEFQDLFDNIKEKNKKEQTKSLEITFDKKTYRQLEKTLRNVLPDYFESLEKKLEKQKEKKTGIFGFLSDIVGGVLGAFGTLNKLIPFLLVAGGLSLAFYIVKNIKNIADSLDIIFKSGKENLPTILESLKNNLFPFWNDFTDTAVYFFDRTLDSIDSLIDKLPELFSILLDNIPMLREQITLFFNEMEAIGDKIAENSLIQSLGFLFALTLPVGLIAAIIAITKPLRVLNAVATASLVASLGYYFSSFKSLESVNWETISKAGISIGILYGALFLTAKGLPSAGVVKNLFITGGLAAGIILYLEQMGNILKQWNDINWDSLGKAGASITGLFLTLTAAGAIGTAGALPALVALGVGLAAAGSAMLAIRGIGESLKPVMGVYRELRDLFEDYTKIDYGKLSLVAGSVTALTAALTFNSITGGVNTLINTFTDVWSKITGQKSPLEKLKEFEALDGEKLDKNAKAIKSIFNAIKLGGNDEISKAIDNLNKIKFDKLGNIISIPKPTQPGNNNILETTNTNTKKEAPIVAEDFVLRPNQPPILFSPNDSIIGLKRANLFEPLKDFQRDNYEFFKEQNKLFVNAINKSFEKIKNDRVEDRKIFNKLNESIENLTQTQSSNVNMVNNSKNLTNITISPVTSKSYRESRFVV